MKIIRALKYCEGDLCGRSCYPLAVLGTSPPWYRSRAYRARVVRLLPSETTDPRKQISHNYLIWQRAQRPVPSVLSSNIGEPALRILIPLAHWQSPYLPEHVDRRQTGCAAPVTCVSIICTRIDINSMRTPFAWRNPCSV